MNAYYQIINDLTTSLDKVYPTKQTASFDSDAEKNTFEDWISELKEGDALVTARKENETNVFEKTETKDKEDVTTYNAYMIINTPMYLDTEIVVKGGYLEFTESTYAEDANEALNTLKDKTDVELLNALSALDSTASVSTELKKSDVLDADENLHNWLFSDDRNANDTAVVTAKDGKSAYVAVFSEKAELWASTAKSNYVTEKVEEWVDSLTEKYTPNEKVLDKLGEPTTTAETTGSETTSAESTAEDADLNG